MREKRLSVTDMSWISYPGTTDADKVIYAIENALDTLEKEVRDKIESITINRNVNPNE